MKKRKETVRQQNSQDNLQFKSFNKLYLILPYHTELDQEDLWSKNPEESGNT